MLLGCASQANVSNRLKIPKFGFDAVVFEFSPCMAFGSIHVVSRRRHEPFNEQLHTLADFRIYSRFLCKKNCRFDSVVNDEICHDLLTAVAKMGNGNFRCPKLFGTTSATKSAEHISESIRKVTSSRFFDGVST